MRHEGRKLTYSEFAAANGTRGELCLWKRPDRAWQRGFVPVAFLSPVRHDPAVLTVPHLLPPLDQVKLVALRGDAFVLSGIEEIGSSRPRQAKRYRQAWWCRLVPRRGPRSLRVAP